MNWTSGIRAGYPVCTPVRRAQFLPHLLAIDPATAKNPALRFVASEGDWYLLEHGDLQTGHVLAR
jgi:hypothetical protein